MRGASSQRPFSDERQLDLFADKVVLEREIDEALESGALDAARRLRDAHREA